VGCLYDTAALRVAVLGAVSEIEPSIIVTQSHGPLNFLFLNGTAVQDVGGTRFDQQKIVDEDSIGAGAEKGANRVPWANDRGFAGKIKRGVH
jgi:hypothetical protein